jgi:uncharacterized membrane protein
MPLHSLAALAAAWQSYYANHALARTLVAFAHVAPLIAGAGFAVAADSEILRTREDQHERRFSVLERLRASHDVVLTGLGLTMISGVLLFASDVDTYLHSKYFWAKMALVALLVVNGAFVRYADQRAIANPDAIHWRPLRYAAAMSISLWFLTTLIGVALPNVG